MATRTLSRTVCDMPGHGDKIPDAQPTSITTPDGVWQVDLCAEHAAHFLAPVLAAGRRQRGGPRRRRQA